MKFMNLTKWNGCGYQEEAGGEDNGGGGGGGDNDGGNGDPSKAGKSGVMLSDGEYKQFQAMLNNAGDDKSAGDGGQSAYDKLKDNDKSLKDKQQLTADIKNNVIFDKDFNGFISANKTLFSMDAERMRTGAKDLDGQDLTDELSKIAVKDFFNKSENIEFLDASDQVKVKAILGQHDKFINGAEAWNLIKTAVNVASKSNRHSDFKNAGGNGGVDTPNLDKYLQKCRDEGKPIIQRAS